MKFKIIYTWINIAIVFCSWLVLIYMSYIIFNLGDGANGTQISMYIVDIIITVIFQLHLYAIIYEKN